MSKNIDQRTVDGFGDEWTRFDQSSLSDAETRELFERYFRLFPWDALPDKPVGFDMGCGSGRWAKLVAPRVARLSCIDASPAALDVCRRNLSDMKNCVFEQASADALPLRQGSQDFGYSLGVLHHIPDTPAALRECAARLKPGAPFLVYLYYALDNRPIWFRALWKASDVCRRAISRLPNGLRYGVSQAIAALVYWPLARTSLLLEKTGLAPDALPLAAYRRSSFYTMRTDALDRFGTRLEQRFTKARIEEMMIDAGLERIEFSDQVPFWCAIGFKS